MSDASGDKLHIVCPHCDAVNRAPKARLAAGTGGTCGRCREPLFTGKPVDLSGPRLVRHLSQSGVPVVVDFWAAWCGPCRAMAPIFERAAAALEPRARFVKVDVDADQASAARYGVQGIPALFLFQGGQVVSHQAGLADEATLRRWVDQASPL